MAEKALKPPSAEYLNSLKTELGDTFQQQDSDIDEARAMREMRVPAMAESDKDYQLVSVDPRDPDLTEEAWQQTAMLTLERPKISIVGGEGDTAQTLASDREHWTAETLWRCGTREPGSDTMSAVTDAALNDGGGWAKVLWMRDVWDVRYGIKPPAPDSSYEAYHNYDKATEDAKKQAGPPFAWIFVDPRKLYPQWSGGKLDEVLEVSEMLTRRAFRKYQLGRDRSGNIVPEELGQSMNVIEAGRQTGSTVEFLEFWDSKWCAYVVAGQNYEGEPTSHLVKAFEHHYPFGVPYDYAPGLTMSYWRNRKVGWGIGRTKQWLVKYRAFLRSAHAQYVARDLLSPLVTYGDTPAAMVGTGDGLPREQDTTVHPGEILNLPPGRQLQRIQYPPPDTLEKHMSLIDQAIRELESPRVTTLSGMEGAGFAISQVLSFTRTRVGPVRHGIEALLLGQTEKLWCLVREMAKEKVWVFYSGDKANAAGYLGLGPSDFEKPMQVSWEVQAELPTDAMLKVRMASERIGNGTWGLDEAVTFMGDNPDEIRRSRARDRIRQSPAYEHWLDAQIFMLAGRGDLLAKAGEAEDLAMQGQLPGGGAPGVFEGGGPGIPTVPDLGALAATPNGAGVNPPDVMPAGPGVP